MAKGIFYTFHNPGELACFATSDAGAANSQIDDLRNRKQADNNGNEIEPIPQVKTAESVAQ